MLYVVVFFIGLFIIVWFMPPSPPGGTPLGGWDQVRES